MPRISASSPGMPLCFDRAASRALDERCVREYGLPTIVLMENAAAQLAGAVIEQLDGAEHDTVLILAGPGSNGGDGLALARHLDNARVRVGVAYAAQPRTLTGDAAVHRDVLARTGVACATVDPERPERVFDELSSRLGGVGVLVDALFGTGCARPVSGHLGELIRIVNATRSMGVRVVSVDIPSALDCDTGTPWGPPGPGGGAVVADLTVTFTGLKPAMLTLEAQPFLGEVLVADIGIPRGLACELGRAVRVGARRGAGR